MFKVAVGKYDVVSMREDRTWQLEFTKRPEERQDILIGNSIYTVTHVKGSTLYVINRKRDVLIPMGGSK